MNRNAFVIPLRLALVACLVFLYFRGLVGAAPAVWVPAMVGMAALAAENLITASAWRALRRRLKAAREESQRAAQPPG